MATTTPAAPRGDPAVAPPQVELLRCESFSLGLACCTEDVFNSFGGSCVKDKAALASLAMESGLKA